MQKWSFQSLIWAQFMGILQDPYRFQHSNSSNGPKKRIIQIAIQNNIIISFKSIWQKDRENAETKKWIRYTSDYYLLLSDRALFYLKFTINHEKLYEFLVSLIREIFHLNISSHPSAIIYN